jgi:GPH family glycoside/pentoside/hexuronide:cation symporter
VSALEAVRAGAEPEEERIPTGRILVYSAPVLGLFSGAALISMYLLKFATDVLLIAPATIGAIFLAGRIWDAVSDPLVGTLSDRTRTRLGRRRPWMLASAVPLGLSIAALWSPPQAAEGARLVAWVGGSFLLFYTFYTSFRVPHMALGAELSRGYHDRTRVFGVMQAVESLGMMLAAGALYLIEQAAEPRGMAAGLSTGIGLLTIALVIVASALLRERAEFQQRGGRSARRVFGDVLGNPHARLLIAVFFFEQLGFAVLIALLPYLTEYVLLEPGSTARYIFAALVALMASIPVWIRLSRSFGKKPVWVFSIAVKILVFACLFFLDAGSSLMLLAVTLVFGAMSGCGSVVGPSLKADVVDWDEGRTGERKEGAYFATWNFAQKTAAGIAGWLTGTMLALSGFEPNVEQGESALLGMRLLVSAWPFALHLAALVLVLRFSLDESAHRAARRQALARSG